MKRVLLRGIMILALATQAIGQISMEAVRALAEQGDPAAQTQLGDIYRSGRSGLQDFGQAVHWYRLAAERGYPPGEVNLGTMYHLRLGIGKNDAAAASWYEKAAK